MSPLLLGLSALSLSALAAPLAADDGALLDAARAELARATELRLPDQPAPYHVVFEVLDGDVVTVGSAAGALTSFDHGPYRTARVEVRVGDETLDNANFDVSFGERDGVRLRGLPQEDVRDALRRELWLATDEAYKGAAEQLSAKLAAQEGREGSKLPALLPVPALTTEVLPRPAVDADAMRARVLALTEAMADHPWLEEADALGRDWQGRRLVLSTEGTEAWLPTGFSVVRVEAVTRAPDGARLRDVRSWVARTADGLPPTEQMVAEVEEMVAWLDALREAPVERDYLGPVLFEQAASVEFFRQLALPELSGTPPAAQPPDPYAPGAETGPPTARPGRRLLPEGWAVVDDPAGDPSSAGFYTHDFEGAPARAVPVVRDGVVRDLLMSRIPREGFEQSTGHGRSLGADRRIALPAAVTVSPDRGRSERKLQRRALALARQAGLPYVLVVRRLAPPAMSEDFEIAFSGEGPLAGLTRPVEAYRLYADGREEPVRGVSFLGVDRRALRDIAMAGPTGAPVGVMDGAPGPQRFSVGTVGGLPASWAVPPVLITEMELRGSGGVEQRALAAPPAAPE
jgi:predicted Zn-dependent protease